MSYSERIINHTRVTITSRKTGQKTTVLETKESAVDYKVGPVVAGVPLIECVDNSLDSFTFTSMGLDTKEPFRRYDIVNFTITDNKVSEYEMLVQSDHVETLSRQFQTYKHTVTAIELTKILEKTKIFNLNLTNPNDTLLDQFKKAINNAELIVGFETDTLSYNRKCRFSISPELSALLNGVPGQDFYNGDTDLRTVLDNILSAVNARVTVTHIELGETTHNIENIKLGYRSLTRAQTIVPNWTRDGHGEIVGEELYSDAQDYAGKIVARGYNTVIREPLSFKDAFKSQSTKINDDNAMVFFPFPISDNGISKFVIYADFEHFDVDTHEYQHVSSYVDIASRLLPREQFDLLSETEQWEYLPYDIGSCTMDIGLYKTRVTGYTESAIKKIMTDCCKAKYGLDVEMLESYWYNCIFEIAYYPLLNTVTEISKPNIFDKDDLLLGIMDSQSEKTIDLDRHGRKLESLIKRTGNDECYIDVKAKRFSSLLPLMAKIDLPVDRTGYTDSGYVVYKRESAIHDTFVNCRYYLSKDFNVVQQNAGVNREKHLYDIPLESDECPLVCKQYMVFDFGVGYAYETSSLYSADFLKSALQTLIGENVGTTYEGTIDENKDSTIASDIFTHTTKGKINYFLFQSKLGESQEFPKDTEDSSWNYPNSESDVFILPCVTYGQAKTMNFVASPLDNYSVGYTRDGYKFSVFGDKGNMIAYNRYVSNASETAGECDRFVVDYAFSTILDFGTNGKPYLGSDAETSIVQRFPVIQRKYCGLATRSHINYSYYKDRTQKPVFHSMVECVPGGQCFGKIIIGSAFCRDNNLVKDNGEGLRDLKIVISYSQTLDDGSEKIPESYVEKEYPVSNLIDQVWTEDRRTAQDGMKIVWGIIDFDESKVQNKDNVKSWAIVNEKGEIYFAVNDIFRRIYIYLVDRLSGFPRYEN